MPHSRVKRISIIKITELFGAISVEISVEDRIFK